MLQTLAGKFIKRSTDLEIDEKIQWVPEFHERIPICAVHKKSADTDSWYLQWYESSFDFFNKTPVLGQFKEAFKTLHFDADLDYIFTLLEQICMYHRPVNTYLKYFKPIFINHRNLKPLLSFMVFLDIPTNGKKGKVLLPPINNTNKKPKRQK
jgi:hypothetical protein